MDVASADIALVRSHHLFAGLDDARFEQLCTRIGQRQIDCGETLFHRGDAARHFFLVANGRVELFVISREGNEKIVEVVVPGQTFAEAVAFMGGSRYPINARGLSAARLVCIDIDAYVGILKEDPNACIRLLGDVSRRLHARLNEIEYLTIENATYRLVRYLMGLVPGDAGEAPTIVLELPRQVIASRISVKPETLSRLLRNLVKAQIITVDGRSVHIHSLQRLRTFQ